MRTQKKKKGETIAERRKNEGDRPGTSSEEDRREKIQTETR